MCYCCLCCWLGAHKLLFFENFKWTECDISINLWPSLTMWISLFIDVIKWFYDVSMLSYIAACAKCCLVYLYFMFSWPWRFHFFLSRASIFANNWNITFRDISHCKFWIYSFINFLFNTFITISIDFPFYSLLGGGGWLYNILFWGIHFISGWNLSTNHFAKTLNVF